jgi:hypothetical protein
VIDSTRFFRDQESISQPVHFITEIVRMKQSRLSVLLAATCFALGCSSSPLAQLDESAGGAFGVGGAAVVGSAGAAVAAAGAAPAKAPGPSTDWVEYPAGPYGTVRGATIANLEFLGWQHPDVAGYDVSHFDTVRLSDFYNPDGRSDLKLLVVNAAAVWCSVCRSEYADMNTNATYTTFRAKGVQILGTLFQDDSYFPAQPSDLKRWGASADFNVTFPFVLDPGFKMGAYFSSDATPLNMLVDVRTMTIVSVTMGYTTTYWADVQKQLDAL